MSKNVKRLSIVAMIATLVLLLAIVGQGLANPVLSEREQFGSDLYFDMGLSEPPGGQSCASCHDPLFGFVDPDKGLPVSEGVIPGLFGGRNSPASAYAMYAPFFDDVEWIGGQFWDGRATGYGLGDPLADQAVGPFLNPVEMANYDSACVVWKVCEFAPYPHPASFSCEISWPLNVDYVCANPSLMLKLALSDDDRATADASYAEIGLSIAAFERTAMFGQFTSKYDHYLQACLTAGGLPQDCALGVGPVAPGVGQKFFTKKEWAGFQLFMNENNDNDGDLDGFGNDPLVPEGAACVLCHVANWTLAADYALPVVEPPWTAGTLAEGMVPPLFTDFTYDNLGVPKSDDKLLVNNPVDNGLGALQLGADGMFKVMTLRNIQQTAPYAHNGFFKKLDDITHFYNTRDVAAEGWAPPEVPGDTVNVDELGNLGLSEKDEDALVKFMKTLDDGWVP